MINHEIIVKMQDDLNIHTAGTNWRSGTTNKGRKIDWDRCIYMESCEAIDSLNWKHWSTKSKSITSSNTTVRYSATTCIEDFTYLSPTIWDVGKEYKYTEWGAIRKIYGALKHRNLKREHGLLPFTIEEFIPWMYSNGFKKLYDAWIVNDYIKWYKPSVDRLDDYTGYTFDNMRLVTWEENQAKQRDDVHNAKSTSGEAICVGVEQLTTEGKHVAFYNSAAEAAEAIGLKSRGTITKVCSTKYPSNKTAKGFTFRYVEKVEKTEVNTSTLDALDDLSNLRIEVVDIFHFLLSKLIATKGVEATELYLKDYLIATKDTLSIPESLEKLIELSVTHNENAIANLKAFSNILGAIDMSVYELYKLYIGKNVLNRFRQDNGYKEGHYIKNWALEVDEVVEDNEVMQRIMEKENDPDRIYMQLNTTYNLVKVLSNPY